MRAKKRERLEEAMQEHKQNEAKEEKILSVSKLSFDEIDYTRMTEKKSWVEQPLPDLGINFLAARAATSKEYKGKLVKRLSLPILILFMLPLAPTQITLWLAVADGVALIILAFSTVSDWQTKQRLLRDKAEAEIYKQKTDIIKARNDAKRQFEKEESDRVALFERILKGDNAAFMLRLDEVLKKINLPFVLTTEVDIYENIPHIKVWPPSKSVIPSRRSFINDAGEVEYASKDLRDLNKQYIEVFAATVMRVVSVVYGNIPVFSKGYVSGMTKDGGADTCLLNFVIADREIAKRICRASNGLSALQQVGAKVTYDQMLNMEVQDDIVPEEWAGVDKSKIKTVVSKSYK